MLAVTAAAVASSAPVLAFNPSAPSCADRTSADIVLSGTDWQTVSTGGLQAGKTFGLQAQQGYQTWKDQVDRWQGGRALTSGGDDYTMRWEKFDVVQGSANTNCLTKVITLNLNERQSFIDGTLDLRGLSTHEWGHVWGLAHSGRKDTYPFADSNYASMVTCSPGGYRDLINLNQDDEAGIQFKTDKSLAKGTVTANSSFEEDTLSGWEYWRKQRVTYTSRGSGGSGSSTYYGIFSGDASHTSIHSETRVYSTEDGNINDWIIAARASTKKNSSTDSGYVTLVLKWRPVDYGEGSSGPCNFVGDILNVVNATGNYSDHYFTLNCTPSTSWSDCAMGNRYMSASADSVYGDGVDVGISLYNRMKTSTGAYGRIHADRIRAQVEIR